MPQLILRVESTFHNIPLDFLDRILSNLTLSKSRPQTPSSSSPRRLPPFENPHFEQEIPTLIPRNEFLHRVQHNNPLSPRHAIPGIEIEFQNSVLPRITQWAVPRNGFVDFRNGCADACEFEEVLDVQEVIPGAVGVEFDGDCGWWEGGGGTV